MSKSTTVSNSKRQKRLTPEAFAQAAECLKVLAHPHRLQMIHMLLESQYAVGELANACSVPCNVASEHLRLMQRCGFLESVRESRNVYYRISEPHLENIMRCIQDRFGT